ncbi:MAG: glycosyltransferase [Planctomycetota bacterium]|nr:glycosyltransferase [Planctomycetota bacterium]
MRVLHVMEATIGGTRRHLVDVVRGLKGHGLDLHVAASTLRDPGFPGDLDALESEGVGVHRIQMVRAISPARDYGDYRRLCALVRELQPDIVHTHSSKAGVLGRRASLATGVGKRVHTPHTFAFLFEAQFSAWKRRMFRALEARLAQETARMIAVSPSEAATMVESGVVPSDRVRVVANGIDPSRVQGVAPLDLAQFDLDPARPTAAVVGLLYEGKGQDLALDALRQPGCESLQLLIVGPGSQDALAASVREFGLAERVRITGPRDDVPAILAALDLLLLPSRWEGMPYIVMEAMAAGLPVVATPVDGARDLIVDGETGALADGIDAEALGRALARVLALNPATRAGLGQAGCERATRVFGLEPMITGLLDVYGEVL